MKNTTIKICALLLILITFNSCVFQTSGDSLEAFSQRMNKLNKNYNMTSENYIIDTKKSTLTKFFRLSENEIMLNFKYDKKHRLNEMNIVFDTIILEESTDSFTFICDCIRSFCQNDNIAEEIFISTDFQNTIKEIKNETICAEADNIKIEIDTTQLGTVISVYKDI